MSTDARLKRLGLDHLKDKPEELKREIEARLKQRREQEEAWLAKRDKSSKSSKDGYDGS